MGGPIPNLACGNSSWTAWANTCAVECLTTLRPSSVLAATGVTSASTSGTQLRSRSFPSASRTTTIASGAPRLGTPASPTAAAAVVPAGTRIGAAEAGLAGALIGLGFPGIVVFDLPLQWFRGRYGVGVLWGCVRLARLEPHEQGVGFGQQDVAVAQPARYEDLATVNGVDPRVELQLFFDRHDVAAVDLEVRGPVAATAGQHRRRHPEHGVEQHPQRPAVHGAVAPEVKPRESGPAVDPTVRCLAGRHGDRQDVAAHGQIHPAPRRRLPFVAVEWTQQRQDLLQLVCCLGDHLIGRVDGTGVILQFAYRVDEPAVVGSALGRRFGRIESTARVFLMVAGHQNTVLGGWLLRAGSRQGVELVVAEGDLGG